MPGVKGTLSYHPGAGDPTKVWQEIKNTQLFKDVETLPLDTPIYENKVRFVFMSDTHETFDFDFDIPNGDVFLHGGDISKRGKLDSVIKFNEFLGKLPHKHKLVIVGNHELTMDPKAFSTQTDPDHIEYNTQLSGKWGVDMVDTKTRLETMGHHSTIEILSKSANCILLHDSITEVYGLKIYGSPWSPEFCNMAFNLKRGRECFDKWQEIPDNVDVLMTHAPPLGRGDYVPKSGKQQGCVDLLNVVQNRVKPTFHVFGHIHEGYGISSDGHTTYINGSTLNADKQPVNLPIIFDVDLPTGVSKDD